ncbi:cytochrome bd-I ubiquinol oxidase subunit 2 apoprotein [Isoptericola jiangsuensis]|uniref:Cytochrome bd-I ubiquinol oxidase subunit 2 apoprotein n=1 Tax=Isoptericola jiangsuensis TaxID=548579 RepID=A0A2A9F2S9_9MICO|nr:cytochrome d ubiquinol oxidase subunit II [Isoptericola jiangsuensis]PFG44729.1 cytochrome bd-I ubiquinol oxidase subunit 2 apoprotein [Isoptericola jiangsuensis]
MNAAGWGLLLAGLLTGWVLVDGAAQGALQLSRTVTGGAPDPTTRDRYRRTVLGTVGPLLLLGEVWLVAAAGVLVGAFWEVESALWARGYPLVVALLVAWVVRDAAVWLRSRLPGARGRAAWDVAAQVAGVALPAAAGALLGTAWLLFALPAGHDVTGPGVVPFRAVPVLLAALCVLGVRVHGGLLLAARLRDVPGVADRARRQVGAALGLYSVVAALTAFAALGAFGGGAGAAVGAALALLLGAVVALAALFDLDRGAAGSATVRSAGLLTAALPVVVTAAVAGPGVVAAAAPGQVLAGLTWPVLAAVVLVAVVQGSVWRLLRGRRAPQVAYL